MNHDVAVHPLNGISFCAGIGGLELGLSRALGGAYRTICVVERDIHAASTLVARMQDGSICEAPVWSDVKTFDAKAWVGLVDIITAGYPCQPFSYAGKRQGELDPRHLWPHIRNHIETLKPRYVFCENVSGHLSLGFEGVCEDLRALGYSIAAGIFTAFEVGASHLRKRLFFVAYAGDLGCDQGRSSQALLERQTANPEAIGTAIQCRIGVRGVAGRKHQGQEEQSAWLPEPSVGRMAHGIPCGVDKLRALGNAVVPQVAAYAWRRLNAALEAELS